MFLFKRILIIFFLFFPISNSFGAMVTFVQKAAVDDSSDVSDIAGIHFNVDGTKMFTMYTTVAGGVSYRQVSEYNLTTAFDVLTKSYAGDSERCVLNHGGSSINSFDLEFSSDGMKLFCDILRYFEQKSPQNSTIQGKYNNHIWHHYLISYLLVPY